MLETLSKGFKSARDFLRKETSLNEENISQALNEVKISLLEADVQYGVVKEFLDKVKEKTLGQTVKIQVTDKKGHVHKLKPFEYFVNACHEELIELMSPGFTSLSLGNFSVIMMVGLQGSGKTTSSAKLARYLKEEEKKRPLLVAADIYRPGAAHQLEILGNRLGIEVFHKENTSAEEICREAIEKAKQENFNVVILDTAGRLSIDEKLMQELLNIKELAKPQYTFLVVDAMIGQDAVKTASAFNEKIDLSGHILTKLDGDARGGAAISIKHITNKPIMFLGMGEDLNSLEPFRPEGLAGRILGMGDVVSLAKDFSRHVDEKEAEKDATRMLKGQFTLNDFIKQLNLIRKIGSFKSILDRIPGMQDMLPAGAKIDEGEFKKFESMIQSMTKLERLRPDLIKKDKGRKERIAKGSGHKQEDIVTLVDRFLSMKQMMQMIGSKGPQALSQMGSMNPFLSSPKAIANKPLTSNKNRKDQRKAQKQARKKNKKR